MKASKSIQPAKPEPYMMVSQIHEANQLQEFKAALARAGDVGGEVVILELTQVEAAALRLCASKCCNDAGPSNSWGRAGYIMAGLRATMESDMNALAFEP